VGKQCRVSSRSPVNKLLPFWAKDIKIGAKMVNARAETVHEKPAFRRAFKSQRALIPVDAFYDWLETDQIGKSGKPLKQPFALPVNCTRYSQPGGRLVEWKDLVWCWIVGSSWWTGELIRPGPER
jgi:hypothetical protein